MEFQPLVWLAMLTLLAGLALGYRQLSRVKHEQEKGDTPPSPAFGAMTKSAETIDHPDPKSVANETR